MIKLLTTPLLILSFLVPLFSQSLNEELTNELKGISNKSSITGFGVAIFSKDTLLYRNGFGFTSQKEHREYTTQTRQKIASISKLLIGVSLLKAQELGLLDIDDDVNDYLPFSLVNPHFPDEVITIRHLATHTSGLAPIPKYDLKALYAPTKIKKIRREMPFGIKRWLFNKTIKTINSNEAYSLKDFLTNLYSTEGKWYSRKHFKKVKPGTQEAYSNSGASLLALVIEKASGIPYADFVKRHITTPLNLVNSKFDFETSSSAQESTYYNHAGISIPDDYKLLLYPAGGYESTIDDFSKFMISIVSSNSILSEESTKEMLSPQPGQEYGILWEVYPSGYIGHTGDIIGVTTYAFYNVNKDIGYLLFCNSAGNEPIYKDIDEIINTLKSHFDKFITARS